MQYCHVALVVGDKTVADSRYSSTAINPIQGKSEHLLTLQSKIMQNTLEQLVLSLPGQWILATYLTASAIPRVIPSLVIIFVFGRILFIIGYNKHPMKRSYGMSMTAAPTIATHIYCLFFFVCYRLLGLLTPSNPIRLAQMMRLAQMAREKGFFSTM